MSTPQAPLDKQIESLKSGINTHIAVLNKFKEEITALKKLTAQEKEVLSKSIEALDKEITYFNNLNVRIDDISEIMKSAPTSDATPHLVLHRIREYQHQLFFCSSHHSRVEGDFNDWKKNEAERNASFIFKPPKLEFPLKQDIYEKSGFDEDNLLLYDPVRELERTRDAILRYEHSGIDVGAIRDNPAYNPMSYTMLREENLARVPILNTKNLATMEQIRMRIVELRKVYQQYSEQLAKAKEKHPEPDEVPEPVRRMREVEDDEEIEPVFRMREVEEEQPSVETKADHDTPVIEVSVTPSVKQPPPAQQPPSDSSLNVQLLRNAGDALGAQQESADGMPQSPPRFPAKEPQPIPPMPQLSRQASASQQMTMAIQHPIIGVGKVTSAAAFRTNNQELVSALADRTKLSSERKELYENVAIKIADDKNGVQLTIPNATDPTKPNVLTRSFTGDVGTVRLTNPPPPGDKACFVFVDTNRDLAPLVIKTPNGAENLLKVYEASKRGGVEIKFEGEALEQVQNDERYKFLASLKGPSLEAFKKDVSDNPRPLGGAISEKLQEQIEKIQQQEAEPVTLRGTSPKKS